MSIANPVVSNVVVGPIDRTAATPSISFGGDAVNNSGTGIYGTIGSVKVPVSGADKLMVDAHGVAVSGAAAGLYIFSGAGAPTDNVTGLNFAGIGALYIDVTNGVLYINTTAMATPTWVTVGSQT